MHFKNKAGRRALALSLCAVLAASVLSPLGADAVQAQESRQDEEKAGRVDGRGDVLRLYYDEPAPITGIDNLSRDTDTGFSQKYMDRFRP